MKFIEKSRITKTLFQGWIGISKTSFEIHGATIIEDRKLLYEFINSDLDIPQSNKYVNGIVWNHTDKDGIIKKFKVVNFGPYTLEKISITDFIEIHFTSLYEKLFKIVSDTGDENKSSDEYKSFLKEAEKLINPLNISDNCFFLLAPSSEKEAEFHPYNLDYFLCIFSINRVTNILTIIQVDDS
jgi:hypothetical protein